MTILLLLIRERARQNEIIIRGKDLNNMVAISKGIPQYQLFSRMPLLVVLVLFSSILIKSCNAHSWIIDVGLDGGRSRGGISGGDLTLQRYFCPLANLDDCQPDPKHDIELTADALRPCRPNVESEPRALVTAGSPLYLSWMGNGHVANGQSDGTCVKVMISNFTQDPSFQDFVEIPGAECIDYWHYNAQGDPKTDTEIIIPSNLVVPNEKYTILWFWDFTEFWYSSCADIDIVPASGSPTKAPNNPAPIPPTGPTLSPSPEPSLLDKHLIKQYLINGCNALQDASTFCIQYIGPGSYCKDYNADECGRSVCHGGGGLLPCSSFIPSQTPAPPHSSTLPPTMFCPPTKSSLQVEFQADSKTKKQNKYYIYNKKKKGWKLLVKKKKIKNNSLHKLEICVEDNKCHKFKILDKNDDGICCEDGYGYYKLIYGGVELINSSIPNGNNEITEFGNCKQEDMTVYLEMGCSNNILPATFCTESFGSGSYCKDYQMDTCDRSVCQGQSHEALDPCS